MIQKRWKGRDRIRRKEEKMEWRMRDGDRQRKREGRRAGQGGAERLPGPHFTGDFLYPLFLQY